MTVEADVVVQAMHDDGGTLRRSGRFEHLCRQPLFPVRNQKEVLAEIDIVKAPVRLSESPFRDVVAFTPHES